MWTDCELADLGIDVTHMLIDLKTIITEDCRGRLDEGCEINDVDNCALPLLIKYAGHERLLVLWAYCNKSLVTRKPVFGVCDQVRHKPACSATEVS